MTDKTQNVNQNDRPTNPYKDLEEDSKPKATSKSPTPSVAQTTPTPDTSKNTQHSAQRCPPFSPPYPDTQMTPYSPHSPQLKTNHPSPAVKSPPNSKPPSFIHPSPLQPTGNPPRPPAAHPIKTPPRSHNPYFVYPDNQAVPSPSTSTAGNTPHAPDIKRKLDFTTLAPK